MNFICHEWTSVSAEGEDNSEENKTEKNQSENSDLPRSLEDSKNEYIRNENR